MRHCFLLLTAILFYGINLTGQVKLNLENDKTIRKFFSSNEIESLKLITSHIDQVVMDFAISTDTVAAYHEFLDSIFLEYGDWENIYTKINPNPQKRIILFNALNENNFFKEIWQYQTPTRVQTRDTFLYNPKNFHELDLNFDGKYFKYLKKLSHKDHMYKKIHYSIMVSGSISPTLRVWTFKSNSNFNFTLEYNRLFIAINLLTIENLNLKVKEYLHQNSQKSN